MSTSPPSCCCEDNSHRLPCSSLQCRQFHYFYLTDSGIEYLRQYLHLPAETVPNTHKKPARPAGAREERPYGGDRGDRGDRRPGGFGRGERAERSGGEGGYRRAAAPAATE